MTAQTNKQAPLAGIRVIDFGHYIAGPLAGMLLADQGADVIKIDRPGKPDYDHPADAVFNRGKKRLTLDLKQPSDLATAKALIETADVVIENFRPGVTDRLGLGAQAMTTLNPGLVYLSLPGFAASDTERASVRAYEGVVGAAVGLYTDLQTMRRNLNAPPIYTPIPLGSTYGAIHGVIAVTLALYAREVSGQGEIIEAPLAGAAMSAMAIINLQVENQPKLYEMLTLSDEQRAALPDWCDRVQAEGEAAIEEFGKTLTGTGSPASGTYMAGDGTWIYILAGGHNRNSQALLRVLDLYEDLVDEGMVDVPVYENLHLDIPDSGGWSKQWNLRIRALIEGKVASEPAAHWVQILTDVGIPCAIHRSTKDWLNAPETDAAALTVEVDDPIYGPVRQLGVQTWLSSTDQSFMQPISSRPFNNSDAAPSKSASTKTNRAPSNSQPLLKGVRVLDLSNILAGPASARTLAEYGADVIKIDPTNPTIGPRMGFHFPIEVSPGKRSLLLDLKHEKGKQIFYDLVKTADIVVHNFRPGVADRLEIDYERLAKIKSDLVYVNLTAFNGPRPGPWMHRPGFDPLLQAATGIQMRYGGKGETPLLHGWASCIDYITGYSATFGMALGLLRTRRPGQTAPGDLVTTSLAQGAQLVQAPLLVGTKDIQPGEEVHGQQAIGEHALNRLYQAQDGWLFVAIPSGNTTDLQALAEFDNAPDDIWADDAVCATYLAERIATKPVDTWVQMFQAADIGCHRVDSLVDIRDAYLHEGPTAEIRKTWDDGRSISWVSMTDHPVGGAVELAAPAYARLQNAPIRLLSGAPKLGTHTEEILRELGYSTDQIDTLLVDGVIKTSLNEDYLPS
ncbi:MAG: CoA transferase [Chloroflexota bacterium]